MPPFTLTLLMLPVRAITGSPIMLMTNCRPIHTEERHHGPDRKSTRLNSSHRTISYAVFCLNTLAHTSIYTLSLHDALPIFEEGHRVAHEVRHQLLHHLPYLANATIHVDPANASGEGHHRISDHAHDKLPAHSH